MTNKKLQSLHERRRHLHPDKVQKLVQFIKYCLVGVLNTLITFGVIYLCKSLLEMNLYVSNALGYICGVINSFLCNKQWVFHSKGSYRREAVKFLVGFGVCYALQFAVVWMLTQSQFGSLEFLIFGIVLSGYGIATVLGNVVYTLANFVYNRTIAFK
ncbi:MAG: GtrA family protein [Muribaculaceae bacterium]|nr:GtrA family protein [Muribaculaceae bacterium]